MNHGHYRQAWSLENRMATPLTTPLTTLRGLGVAGPQTPIGVRATPPNHSESYPVFSPSLTDQSGASKQASGWPADYQTSGLLLLSPCPHWISVLLQGATEVGIGGCLS